ncbi:hypothetical protein Tsubulata_050217, partial [Turnera subulata]
MASISMFLILSSLLLSSSHSLPDQQGFDVRQHLSTVTRYDFVKDVAHTKSGSGDIPDQCTPIHVNLVARHGTRSPTKKRMRELDRLASHLQDLIRDAEDRHSSIQKVPAWMKGWTSPWKGKVKGGELIRKGEEEMYNLGIRVRERFPDLFNEPYHHDAFVKVEYPLC